MKHLVLALLLIAPAAPALADPDDLCGLEEDRGAQAQPCPAYVTYDEEGEEVGGAAG